MTLPGFPEAAPLAGLVGGVLIGLAAAVMLLGLGRIAGVSGLAAKAVGLGGSGIASGGAWMFVIGLPLGALVVMLASGGIDATFASPITLAIAGLIVGIGTRLGSGCTSGHGVCGVSRLSARSIVATLTFMPFILSGSVATLTSLDFLGFGLPVTAPSLGRLLAEGKSSLDAPWLALTGFLTVAIMMPLLVFIGEAVRDAFDPRKTFR